MSKRTEEVDRGRTDGDVPLLERVASGDPGAVRDVVDAYGDLVWSLALRGTETRADAEDAVQEIFLDVWRSAGRYDSSKSTEAGFVALLARRRLIDARRKRDRRPRLVAPPPGLQAASAEHERIERRVQAEQVLEVIRTLRPKQREVMELSLIDGLSHGEISERTDTPLGTVKSMIRRGLIEVRNRLTDPPVSRGAAGVK